MEPKKIKKLVLKKETIASLSNHNQNNIRGGSGVGCILTALAWTLCGAVGSCPANACKPGDGNGGNTNTYLDSVPYAAGNCPYPPHPESGYQWCFSVPLNTCY